jgi:hypothetical protein
MVACRRDLSKYAIIEKESRRLARVDGNEKREAVQPPAEYQTLPEQVRVRAGPDQNDLFCEGLVDQQPVQRQVAFAQTVILPF